MAQEISARIGVGDRFETAEDADAIARLIVDALWFRFEIRERERS